MDTKKTTARRVRTPAQQHAYDELDRAWKVAARAIAADLPFHVPAHVIRKALATNMAEIVPLAAYYRDYEAAMTAEKDPS